MHSKEKLRKKFLLLRKKKYFSVKKKFYKPLIKLINSNKKKTISIYFPSNYEVDTLNLFEIFKLKKEFKTCLPKILPGEKMKFVKWSYLDPLIVNKYGFLEPLDNLKEILPKIIIVPLVAFDKFHNRLGYGKGYYDKFLSKYTKEKKSVLTIGLAFSFQKYKKIPITKSDIKLDYILTEKGIF